MRVKMERKITKRGIIEKRVLQLKLEA